MAVPIGPVKGRGVANIAVLNQSTATSCIRKTIMLLFLAIIGIHLWAVLRYVDKTKQINHSALPLSPKNEYIMWSKDEGYVRDCALHYKGNHTWGRLHAPYVDKLEAKVIVEGMNVPSLKIPSTLAVLDKKNISMYSLEFMTSLKQPYIIKSTHLSGGVARVYNNKYHCFKYCFDEEVHPLGPIAFKLSLNQSVNDIHYDYSKNGAELQYKYVTPRIIFEEDVITSGKTNTDVTFWWLSNGHPVFVSQQCGRPAFKGMQGWQMNRVFLGTDYRRLPIVFNRGTCIETPPKPRTWNTQLEIMKQLGKEFPGEVVRIDVYGGGDEVWFSEFTFTTAGCWRSFQPAVADGLLYGLMKEKIARRDVTPDRLYRMLNDKSWVLLLENRTLSAAYPSPVDLCSIFEEFSANKEFVHRARESGDALKLSIAQEMLHRTRDVLFKSCIRELKKIQKFPLRCIYLEKEEIKVHSFGVTKLVKDASNVESCATTLYGANGRAFTKLHLPRPPAG